ncbi:MAG TPA: O-methyltransferase [Cyclobacteriaceae bacterium]|nr:O-methyltransferase [Cyclobacteriaceae bacterium]
MEFISEGILKYAEEHTSPESGILKEIDRETHVNNLFPRMLSGHYQGRFLSMISSIIKPACILEIGTYTGYSAICLTEGLAEGGKIHSIEINAELEGTIRRNLERAGVSDRVLLYFGEALKIIPSMNQQFDLVFLDADKINYGAYYELLIRQMKPGAIMIADNVLWSGKVINKEDRDKEAAKLRDFNDRVNDDARVENILLPIRDGIMLIRKSK